MNLTASHISPTTQFYNEMQATFKYFNNLLFDGKLPDVMFTLQRNNQVMGYFSSDRWASKNGNKCHEIAINPSYVARSSVIEFMQTLVHEMTHLWQHSFGSPGRTTYHNREWANKMISIGLMPSDTGRVGGKTTGDHMNDYPIKDGRFLQCCIALIENEKFQLAWVDRYAKTSSNQIYDQQNSTSQNFEWSADTIQTSTLELLTSPAADVVGGIDLIEYENSTVKSNAKTKFMCGECGVKAWGKASLNIICGNCKETMHQT